MTPSEYDGGTSPTADALNSALSGRYVIERELGRGGMATVYLARDLRHARAVAVKVMSRDVVAFASRERFLREIRMAAQLTHPHVLGVHDSGESDGLLYYVMPYVDGETLRARLARAGALPVREAIRLVRELADALAHAHAHGIVHRDMKPENVLLSGRHAVVADFGIAKALEATQGQSKSAARLTGTGVSLGTPAYMAPEQVVGDGATDHRADLYALGVVAYEVLTGAHPFGARTPQTLVAAHLTEAPPPLASRRADVPPPLAALVMQLLSKDPTGRPPSAEAVVRALDDLPTLSIRSAPRTPVRVVGIATLVFVVMLGGYLAWRRTAFTASPQPDVIHTLAVLPFVNTSGNSNDDYFSDGLTDELAHALARLPGLTIAGRTSSYSFKGKSVRAPEIGRALDVSALVEGTVQRAGDRLRVTTQLVRTRDDKVLWDTLYESQSGDVFGVQDQFTRAVVAALRPSLGDRHVDSSLADVGRGTTDQEAYELYLKGRYYWMARGTDNVKRSIDYFKHAIARDPNFARAHAGLAQAYIVSPVWIPDPLDTTPALVAASAERALALDSTLADAQMAYASTLEDRLQFSEAEAHYRKAIALDSSNTYAHHTFGLMLLNLGRTDDAIKEIGIAAQLDPLAKSAGSAAALALVFGRRFPEAIAASRRVLKIDSTYMLANQVLGMAFLFGGHPDSAVRAMERPEQVSAPAHWLWLLVADAAAGRWTDAERVRAELHRPGTDQTGGGDAAFADFVFGDREPLVKFLATHQGQRRWATTNHLGCNPLLDPLWDDARFRGAMHALTIEPCPLAKPWPFAAKPAAKNGP
jgi:eukaryotic-like serine/threonine-protein kinase